MPVMDGYETMRMIRGLPERGDVPIVAVTAKVGVGERQLCLDAGATDYIPKPIDTAELMAMLEKWLPDKCVVAPSPDDPVTEALAAKAPAGEHAGSLGAAHPATAKVLLIDDDFRNIFALTTLLERGGLVVVSAQSGGAGIELFESTPDIALVLMDIMMPVLDGYATMREIRKLPTGSEVPIIAVTAKVGDSERLLCLQAGASDYIPKPVDTPELLRAIGRWLPAVDRSTVRASSAEPDELAAELILPG